MIKRTLKISLSGNNAAFVWGPRKTGKSTLLHQQFPHAKWYDLLNTRLKTSLMTDPHRLTEEILAQKPSIVIIDEVQKVPQLLDEVHWCLENTKTKFVLCGSSARKLKRGASNLLGGRAWKYELFPLTTFEVKNTELLTILNHGLIPQHFLAAKPEKYLTSYLSDYINEEIHAEALVRNVPAFSRFLHALTLTHGQITNYANIASDCGVSPKTVKLYYEIIEDTLMGHKLEAWRKVKKRRLIETDKFYLFDVGIVRAAKGMMIIQEKTEEFGWAFEHFMIEEIRAYLSYREKNLPLSYWRTSNGMEVDLIVGDGDLALEFKATSNLKPDHLKGLKTFLEENKAKHAIVICCIPEPRQIDGILALPWKDFCQRLWGDELL